MLRMVVSASKSWRLQRPELSEELMEIADPCPESCLVVRDGGNNEQDVKDGWGGVQVMWTSLGTAEL
jgi:hypothetical protein